MQYLSISANHIPLLNMYYKRSIYRLDEFDYFKASTNVYAYLKSLLDDSDRMKILRNSIVSRINTNSIATIRNSRTYRRRWIISKYFLGMVVSDGFGSIVGEGIVPLAIPCIKRNLSFSYRSPVYFDDSVIPRMSIEDRYREPLTNNINPATISEWVIMVNTSTNRNLLKFYLREILGILPKAKFPKIIYCTTEKLETEFGKYVTPTIVAFSKEKQKSIFQEFVTYLANYMNETDQRSRNHDVLSENMSYPFPIEHSYSHNYTGENDEQIFESSPISFTIEQDDSENDSLEVENYLEDTSHNVQDDDDDDDDEISDEGIIESDVELYVYETERVGMLETNQTVRVTTDSTTTYNVTYDPLNF